MRNYPCFAMDDDQEEMSDLAIHQKLGKKGQRMLYVYDFMSLWTFFVEIMDMGEPKSGTDYPQLVLSVGNTPEEAPDKNWGNIVKENGSDGLYDVFDDDDPPDQLGYDEDDQIECVIIKGRISLFCIAIKSVRTR